MGAFGRITFTQTANEVRSGHICHWCDEEICLTEEAVLLQIVYPFGAEGKLRTCVVDDGAGNFRFPPRFMHLDCWEELVEELLEKLPDVPLLDPQQKGLCDCSLCASEIRAWESSGLLTFGELRRSKKQPDGCTQPAIHFDECGLGTPQILCVGCIMALEEEVIQLWEDFSHNGECPEGTHARCWRTGQCTDFCQEKLKEYEHAS